jgi:hypothetical protein
MAYIDKSPTIFEDIPSPKPSYSFHEQKFVLILVTFTTLCDENMSAFCVNIIMSFGQILTPFSEFVIYVTPILPVVLVENFPAKLELLFIIPLDC